MKKWLPRFGTLIIGFVIGIGVFTFLEARTVTEAKLSLDDEWHRLYEAAAMSGDSDTLQDVTQTLLCVNSEGIPGGKLTDRDGVSFCHYRDGSRYETPHFTLESYHRKIMKTHLKWSIENLDFVRTISTKENARDYVAQHRSLIR